MGTSLSCPTDGIDSPPKKSLHHVSGIYGSCKLPISMRSITRLRRCRADPEATKGPICFPIDSACLESAPEQSLSGI